MSDPQKYILLLGCFDTKGEEFAFLRECLLAKGEKVKTMDTGVMSKTARFPVDIGPDQVASEAGVSLEDLRQAGDRGQAVKTMGKGAANIVARLNKEGGIKAVIGMGGGAGTFIALTAMQAVPLGVPKLCISTLAGKDLSRLMGSKDITLMPSIVDVAGLNSMLKLTIQQAAAAICAMSKVIAFEDKATIGSIAISLFGNTNACVEMCSELLKKQGYEVFTFHANGVGGKTMEALIQEGVFDAVLDITTTELADDLCGGVCSAGPDRLNAAAEMGIPQVVAPGCLDMVNFAELDTVPEPYKSRELYSWAPIVTLMRTNEEENRQLGKKFAQKLNRSKGKSTILLPLKGLSQIDAEGGVFFRPETNQVLFETIKKHAKENVKVVEVDAHINDKKFAEMLVKVLLNQIENNKN